MRTVHAIVDALSGGLQQSVQLSAVGARRVDTDACDGGVGLHDGADDVSVLVVQDSRALGSARQETSSLPIASADDDGRQQAVLGTDVAPGDSGASLTSGTRAGLLPLAGKEVVILCNEVIAFVCDFVVTEIVAHLFQLC